MNRQDPRTGDPSAGAAAPAGSHSVRDDLTFFGTMISSHCHELKNVLATIGEFADLLDELGCTPDPDGPLSPEQMRSICGRISKQVERGRTLVQWLSRFAHSADEDADEIDLAEVVTEVVELSRRFAYLGQVELKARVPDVSATSPLDPFDCRHAVFLAIKLALAAATRERSVTVELELEDEAPRIFVRSADPFDAASARKADLRLLESVVARLGGKIEWTSESGKDRLVLSLE